MPEIPPLTESEVQAEKARHRPRDYGSEHRCVECQQDWPCPTIRLIAEREWLNQMFRSAEHFREEQQARAEAAEQRVRELEPYFARASGLMESVKAGDGQEPLWTLISDMTLEASRER